MCFLRRSLGVITINEQSVKNYSEWFYQNAKRMDFGSCQELARSLAPRSPLARSLDPSLARSPLARLSLAPSLARSLAPRSPLARPPLARSLAPRSLARSPLARSPLARPSLAPGERLAEPGGHRPGPAFNEPLEVAYRFTHEISYRMH